MLLGEGDLRGRSPQPVEIVEFTNAGKEDVHDEVPVVEQDPPSLPDPLDSQGAHPVLFERLLDMMGDGGDLPVGAPRTEEEVVGERRPFPDVQRADVDGFLLLRQPGALEQDFPCRYGRLSSPASM